MKSNTSPIIETIDVGNLIRKYIKKKRISKAAVARFIGKDDRTMLRYEKSVSLKSNVIMELSHAMEHNFFQDIAATLPAHYSTDAPVDTTLTDKIAALEQRILILEAEKAVLLIR
ncbi:MAG TPA: hypothetical protein DCS17_10330 [Flavobacterium sp.]|nr:hypothetical protein [Flavobacterium sp.]